MQDDRDIGIAVRTMLVSGAAPEKNGARHIEAPGQSLHEGMCSLVGYGIELRCIGWHFTPRDERSSSALINWIHNRRFNEPLVAPGS